MWRRHAYNNAVESLRKVFAQEIKQKELEGLAIEGIRNQELEELDMLIAENEKRNQEAARMRFEFSDILITFDLERRSTNRRWNRSDRRLLKKLKVV